MINIAVYNQAKTPLNLDLCKLICALQKYFDEHLQPAWNLEPVKLHEACNPIPGMWAMAFMDDADAPGALAYHTELDNLPMAKVFVATIENAKEDIATAASHELAEMLVDPTCGSVVPFPSGGYLALEVCDPVEETTFLIDGFAMSDFVLPAYFNAAQPNAQMDYTHILRAPFTMAIGGYQSIFNDNDWTEVFGSHEKSLAFEKEHRKGHRSQYRKCAGIKRVLHHGSKL